MQIWRQIGQWLTGSRGNQAEEDTRPERHESRSRKGRDGDGNYVGRTVGVDDSLDVGETGAEARGREGTR
jgi:hypothetical protein